MEAKPFSLQSPEKVAEIYGGNKQKIAQAIQMGVVDPTSGLLAGMFIDRMRSAQMMEQAPQQTVAQQVFTPPAPAAPPAGLGAIAPQGGGMPAPPPPQAPMGAPPVGMAAGGMTELPVPNDPYNTNSGGGLTTLPLPDNMYDEQSFAGGGVVAFAAGDYVNFSNIEDALYALRTSKDPKERSAAKAFVQNYGSSNQGKPPLDSDTPYDRSQHTWLGNMVRGQGILGPNATPEPGSTADIITNMLTGKGMMKTKPPRVDTPPELPNIPMPQAPQALAPQFTIAQGAPAAAPSATPRANAPAPSGGLASIPMPTPRPDLPTDQASPTTPAPSDNPSIADLQKMFAEAGKLPDFQKMSAEDRAARKNEDLWSALAQIGFGMAAGESPNALTNIGKATAAAVPGMQASIKERRADEKDERNREFDYLVKAAGVKGDSLKSAYTVWNSMKDREQQKTLEEMRIAAQAEQGELTRKTQLQVANINANSSRDTGTERLVRAIAAGRAPNATPEQARLADAAEFALKGFAGATGGAEIANKARDNVDNSIKNNLPLQQMFNKLAQQDRKNAKEGKPTALYQNKYEEMVDNEFRRLSSSSLSTLNGTPQTGAVKPGWSLVK